MKILVCPHDMNMGGSQLNAIELAAEVKKLGHDVVIFGQPGSLTQRVAELGLEFIQSPRVRFRPTPAVTRALREIIEERGIDIVHGYEWPPALEATLAVGIKRRARAVSTVLSMSVAPFIPKHVPLMVGTEQIASIERDNNRAMVCLMEPPVDTELNSPGIDVGTDSFAVQWGIDPALPVISIISRLAHEMKLEGILAAISVIERRNLAQPVQLLIAGDGPARQEVHEAAEAANRRMGAKRVILTGQLDDPRPAYLIADVVLGMGGSALRAMAFQKPLIVQGENGFWQTLSAESLHTFLWQGWYGVGIGAKPGEERLFEELSGLLNDRERRLELGKFSRATLVARFSLQVAAERQVQFYREALTQETTVTGYMRSMGSSSLAFVAYNLRRLAERARGRLQRDDFNASPVVSLNTTSESEVAA